MIHKLQSSRSSKIIGRVALLIVATLLVSCPAPTPTPPDDMDPGNGMDPPDAPPLTRGDFDLVGLRQKITDIWSDGTTMWVLSFGDKKIYAYKMSDKTRDTSKDFTTLPEAGFPVGIWSDRTTMWVVSGRNIRAYKMEDKTRDASKDFTNVTLGLDTSVRLQGIWSDGITMWAVDAPNNKIHAFRMDNKMPDTDKEIEMVGNGAGLQGLWGDATTLWVLNTANTPKSISAYNRSDKMLNNDKTFDLSDEQTGTVTGIWSDGTTIWVGRQSRSASTGRDRLWAYNLMDKVRDP